MTEVLRTGWCARCGQPTWTGTDHACVPPAERLTLDGCSRREIAMADALVQADLLFDGKHPEPERAKAVVRRILWQFQFTDSDRVFFSIPTSVDALPPSSWD